MIAIKKSINQWCMPDSCGIEELVSAAEGMFDGVEPVFGTHGRLSAESTVREIREIRNMVTEHGLEIYSLAGGFYWESCFTSDDKAEAGRAADLCKRHIDAAAELGAPVILIVPGSGHGANGRHVPYNVLYERAVEAMQGLAPYARRRGVVIGVENVWNRFLLSPLEMRRFIDDIASDSVRSYFDIGNVLINSWPEDWIRILAGRICAVHIKDFSFENNFVPLLQGDVNFPSVMDALSEIGYDGALTAEIAPPQGTAPGQCAKQISASLDKIMGGFRK